MIKVKGLHAVMKTIVGAAFPLVPANVMKDKEDSKDCMLTDYGLLEITPIEDDIIR